MMDCLEWEGRRYPSGYGRLCIGQARGYAHRAVYEAQYGPIPEGCEIHHECGNKSCANPHHLVAMPKGSHTRHHMTKEVCKRGHLLAETRRQSPCGRVGCIECDKIRERNRAPRDQRAYMREWRLARKAEVVSS